MNTPLLDAIKKAAAGEIPVTGFTSGLNNVLAPPPTEKAPKVITLEKAEKERKKASGGSSTSQRGPRVTTNLNSANIANYKPTMGGFKQ